jgi:hypothetical protein
MTRRGRRLAVYGDIRANRVSSPGAERKTARATRPIAERDVSRVRMRGMPTPKRDRPGVGNTGQHARRGWRTL